MCGACLVGPPEFDRMRAAVAYGDIPRTVALKLKYGGRPGVAETIARLVLRHVDGATDAILAPVPLHRWRIWKLHQAALIAARRRHRPSGEAHLLERVSDAAVAGAMNFARQRSGARSIAPVEAGGSHGRLATTSWRWRTSNGCARCQRRRGAQILCWAWSEPETIPTRVVRRGGRAERPGHVSLL